MEPFKTLISPELVRLLAGHLARHLPPFDPAAFCAEAIPRLVPLEMKARVAMLADLLAERLPTDTAARNAVLLSVLHPDTETLGNRRSDRLGVAGWGIWPLSTLVGRTGLDDFEGSLATLRQMTMRHTAEFDVRPFLIADQARALAVIGTWTADPNQHVRRLASEGTRPRLPWGVRLPGLVADPGPALPILTALRDDPSEYVRRSVANHLNDIAKDHPALVVQLAADWMKGAGKPRQALLRHACRSLIKAGNAEALAVFGIAPPAVDVSPVAVDNPTIRVGEDLAFAATIRSTGAEAQALVIDYVIHFRKANGQLTAKVFKGGKATLEPGACLHFARRHSFRPITTRTYYGGAHRVALRINGKDTAPAAFTLSI